MRNKRKNREAFAEHSYWQSYSDMMAALLLFFVFICFFLHRKIFGIRFCVYLIILFFDIFVNRYQVFQTQISTFDEYLLLFLENMTKVFGGNHVVYQTL